MKVLLPASGGEMVEFGDVSQPCPASDEALVRVEAFSVNRGETFLLERPPAGWRRASPDGRSCSLARPGVSATTSPNWPRTRAPRSPRSPGQRTGEPG